MLSEHVCTTYFFFPKMMHIMLATLYTANACATMNVNLVFKRGKKGVAITSNELLLNGSYEKFTLKFISILYTYFDIILCQQHPKHHQLGENIISGIIVVL